MRMTITGTRAGMTREQEITALEVLHRYLPTTILHGACVGADRDMHRLVRRYLPPSVVMHFYPSNNEQFQWAAQECGRAIDTLHPVTPPLTRNRQMVDAGQHVVAFPETVHELFRSGTWATIRYARKMRRPLTIVWPDGSLTEENQP